MATKATKTTKARKTTKVKKPAQKKPGKGAKNNVVPMTPANKAKAQTTLEGMAPLVDHDIEELADKLYNTRKQRMEYTAKEKECVDRLMAEMKAKETREYVSIELGLRVEITTVKEKVKVTKYDPDEE